MIVSHEAGRVVVEFTQADIELIASEPGTRDWLAQLESDRPAAVLGGLAKLAARLNTHPHGRLEYHQIGTLL